MKRSLGTPIALTVAGTAILVLVIGLVTRGPSTGTDSGTGGNLTGAQLAGATDSLTAEIERLQGRVRDSPSDAASWAELGAAYIQQGRVTGDPSHYPRAEGALQQSLTLAPEDNWQAMSGMGALANARHDFRAALRWARRAAAVNPYDATVDGVTDDALTQLGDYEGAMRAVRRMLRTSPGIAAFTRAAYHYEQSGDVPGARRALRRALDEATEPHDVAFCRYHLGELAFDNGDPRAALEQYRTGLAADPRSGPLLAGRAKAQAALGRTADALRDYATVTTRVPDPQYVLEYAELLQALGRDDEAARQFEVLAAQQRIQAANGVVDDLTAAVVEADHGSASAAVRHAEAEWSRRRSVLVEDALAWALHRAGRDREALPHARRADRLGWRNATFRYHLGMIELSLGHRAAARRDLDAALDINPHFSQLHAPIARRALAAAGDER